MSVEEVKVTLLHCGKTNRCEGCPCREDGMMCINKALNNALNTIVELEERIAIIRESMETLEKRNEPKAVEIDREMDSGMHLAHCPNCWKFINNIHHNKYCGYCGQAVKWE